MSLQNVIATYRSKLNLNLLTAYTIPASIFYTSSWPQSPFKPVITAFQKASWFKVTATYPYRQSQRLLFCSFLIIFCNVCFHFFTIKKSRELASSQYEVCSAHVQFNDVLCSEMSWIKCECWLLCKELMFPEHTLVSEYLPFKGTGVPDQRFNKVIKLPNLKTVLAC